MNIIIYLTFIYLILLVTYYFIYLKKINHDNLFIVILNFIFIIILPLYYYYFKDNISSIIISVILLISSYILNIKAKNIFKKVLIPFIIYYFLCCFILGYLLTTII